MAINLANVDISLDTFQRIASGKYNAGEVRLSGEHSLARMNNHVSRRGWNTKTISHAEVIAIKNAFLNALGRGGVDAVRLAAIRRDLGLTAFEGPVDFSLRERSVRPLSRQQIREILDANAIVLNRAAPGTIRTSDDLYGRLSEQVRNERTASRKAVNQSLDSLRTIVANRQISAVQAFVSGDFLFHSSEVRSNLLEDARRTREELRASIAAENRQPRDAGTCRIRVETAGVVLEMPTGKSEKDFLKALDDIVLLLSSNTPKLGEIQVRSDFARLDTAEARLAFVDSLAGNGLKLRALAIHVMQGRSVADAAVLSAVNRLSDADADALCRALLALPDETRGAGVAADPAVRAVLDRATATIPTSGRATVPVFTPGVYNGALFAALSSHHPENLPTDFRRIIDDTVAAMRGRFGEALVPPGAMFSQIAETGTINRAISAATDRGERYSAETFRNTLPGLALDNLVRRSIAAALSAPAAARGIQAYANKLSETIRKALPDFAERVRDAASPEARAAIFDESREILEGALDHQIAVGSFADDAERLARDRIASQTGLSANAISRVCDFFGLRNKAVEIADASLQDMIRNKPGTLDNARKRLSDAANAFADERIAFLKQIDELGLSARTARTLKAEILGMVKVKDVQLGALGTLARHSVDLAPLKELVRNGAPADQIKPAVQKLSADLRTAVIWHFGEENLGVDEIDRYTKVAALLVLNDAPELVESLRQLCDAPGNEALAEMRFADILLSCIPDTRAENEALADDLLAGVLPPFHGKALADAGVALPLPEDRAQALAEQIRQSPAPVSPEELVSLVTNP